MHFYTEYNGNIEPRHFVPMTKDPTLDRPSRVADAKKAAKKGEIWFPSVTTVLNILDKPALVNWKIDQHLDFAYGIRGSLTDCSQLEYKQIIKEETQETLDRAPKAGTDIHHVLENYLYTGNYPDDPIAKKIVRSCEVLIESKTGLHKWNKEKYFIDKKLGYAGCEIGRASCRERV